MPVTFLTRKLNPWMNDYIVAFKKLNCLEQLFPTVDRDPNYGRRGFNDGSQK